MYRHNLSNKPQGSSKPGCDLLCETRLCSCFEINHDTIQAYSFNKKDVRFPQCGVLFAINSIQMAVKQNRWVTCSL